MREEAVAALVLGTFDLAGTFAFAISGALAGVRRRLDIFGVLVLAFAASTFGGILRDVLIGAVPPASIQDWRYVAVAAAAGVVTFFWHGRVSRVGQALALFDAFGLALCAVTGASKALAYHLGPVPAALLGMLTGIGGGVVRDLLVSEVPAVLRKDVYAVAALAGASVLVAGSELGWAAQPAAVCGGAVCLGIRLGAIYWGWRFPVAGGER